MHYDFDNKTEIPGHDQMEEDHLKIHRNQWKNNQVLDQTGREGRKILCGRGKKKRFSEDEMISIGEEVKENPYQALSRQLALKYEVSQSCMLSTLHELDFEYRSTKVFPGLSPEDIRLRVEFTREQDKIPSQLNRVWFSDEMDCDIQMARREA